MKRNTKASRRLGIFGPPPILEGESETSYWELHERMFGALEPADFVDEIWARDAVNGAWTIKRLRQALSVFLSVKVRAVAAHEASLLAEADPELNSGTEEQKQEMAKLFNPDSEFSWEDRQARYPRAAAKYGKLCEAARLTLNPTEIQAEIVVEHIDTIERLEALIVIEQRRLDSILRELDRRRMMRELRHDLHNAEKAKIKTVETKMIRDNKAA
jgi:hypothetical protein